MLTKIALVALSLFASDSVRATCFRGAIYAQAICKPLVYMGIVVHPGGVNLQVMYRSGNNLRFCNVDSELGISHGIITDADYGAKPSGF